MNRKFIHELGMVSRWLYHWNTILNSGSITQSKESKGSTSDSIYIQSRFHTNYEFLWKHDRCIEMQMIHIDLKIVRFDKTKSIAQAKHGHTPHYWNQRVCRQLVLCHQDGKGLVRDAAHATNLCPHQQVQSVHSLSGQTPGPVEQKNNVPLCTPCVARPSPVSQGTTARAQWTDERQCIYLYQRCISALPVLQINLHASPRERAAVDALRAAAAACSDGLLVLVPATPSRSYQVIPCVRWYHDTGFWEPLDLRSDGSRSSWAFCKKSHPEVSKFRVGAINFRKPSDLRSNDPEARIMVSLKCW